MRKLVWNEVQHKVCTSIKILGVYFNYHTATRKKLNFDSIFKSIQKTLSMWRWRGLTLLGRIQIVKTFAIPKFMSKASLISISDDLIKKVNTLFYGFIWKGNDKIIKQRGQHIHPPLNDLIQIRIDGTDTPILKITSKSIYNEFKHKKTNCSFCSKENDSEIPWPFGRVERNLLSSV